MKKTQLLKSYEGATRILAPALPLWLSMRVKNGKEDPERLSERQGKTSVKRPEGPLIWMHAASVGESQMLMPLIKRLKRERPHTFIVITTGTVTSAEMLEKTLPKGTVHQYAPADHPKAVKNFLNHWKPDFAMFAESELWPNMIFGTKNRDIPLALINARMSKDSIERWGNKAKGSAKSILNNFNVILAANTETANGLSWLMGKDIENSGNLKNAAPVLPVGKDELNAFKSTIKRRRVWCATSTHDGEEALLVETLKAVKAKYPKSLFLLAPRHPKRTPEIARIFTAAGYKTQLRSKGHPPAPDTDVYIFDTIGDLGLVYRLSDIAFIGGSLIKGLAGHNPLEAARLNCVIITGSHIASFADTYMALMAIDGVQRVLNPDSLSEHVLNLMSDKPRCAQLKKSALDYAQSRDAVLDYVWDELLPYFPPDEREETQGTAP